MDSNTQLAVLAALILAAVGLSHWRLSTQIDALEQDSQASEAEKPGAAHPKHYERMAEATVTAEDPAARKSALRYLLVKSTSDEDMDPELVDWARTELARQKAAESPGLLGEKLQLDVSGATPEVDRLENTDAPSVGRIEEPAGSEDGGYKRWDEDDRSKGARPPDRGDEDKGLVDPFSE